MPKFIGRQIPGTLQIQNNAINPGGMIRVNYAQAAIVARALGGRAVHCSLDTTDQGGKGSLAKRWYRWFVSADDVLNLRGATPAMLFAAACRKYGPAADADALKVVTRKGGKALDAVQALQDFARAC